MKHRVSFCGIAHALASVDESKEKAMIDKIGQVAGQIWQILGENERVEVSKIPELLKQKTSIAYQGLGWLARENKINYHNLDNKMYVSLVDAEREVFKSVIA